LAKGAPDKSHIQKSCCVSQYQFDRSGCDHFLNALVIFAVATRHRLRTNTTILLVCLAVSDLIAGLIVQPVGIAVDVKRIINEGPFCTLEKIYQAGLLGASFSSISHLVLISLERYIAIKQPLRYEDIVRKRRLTTGVILAWAITLVATIQEIVLAFIDSNTNIYSVYLNVTGSMLAIIGVLCISTIGYTNGYVFSETQRQKKRIKTEQISSEEAKRIKKDHKAAITLVLLLSALIFTYVPAIITFLMAASSVNPVEPYILNILWRWASTQFRFVGFSFKSCYLQLAYEEAAPCFCRNSTFKTTRK